MGNIAQHLTTLDYLIVAAYVGILLFLGVQASLKNRKRGDDETLFLGDRSLGWSSIGFNMWGTNVGPSMLVAFAGVGFSTGIVAVNFDWYAFIFLMLLALIFAPRYLAAKVSTMPEFMGNRYGDSTRTILAWYALIKIQISWLSLGLYAGGTLVRQILGIPMWQSVIVLVAFAGLFTYMGGLTAIAKVNVFQMLLLIVVSVMLTVLGVNRAGGLSYVYKHVPGHFWNLFHPASDPNYPWYAIMLGYPVAAVAFFCTDQSMVQSVLGAKNLEQGQLGVNFIGWLKILSLPLFIFTGILCRIIFPDLKDENLAYMTMVTNLFPAGLNGLVIVVLIAVLVGTIGSSLNSLSTVFTMDIYAERINKKATNKQLISVGRMSIIVGCILSVGVAIALDSIKGLKFFDVFQSILGFIAPPLSVVFLLTVFWKRTTRLAVNTVLSAGSAFSLTVGILYLWVFPKAEYHFWPHYLMLSFYVFAFLMAVAVLVSLLDCNPKTYIAGEHEERDMPKTSLKVKIAWALLTLVMIVLYIIFNGH
ncbi:sodium/solute symporter [Mucilaginibacter galii]|uniref:Solute:sodium symporter (SSS) family transporter n=1 Tax=Mucilaginibacter galii TaxID=2005073 RepID=A0A917JA45_9SPHI|nr:sodium/solute symporter [Mucilaginibacter galii]GGI51643.1 solute:sodium symporter (SSS) family transporter [Mucilaginibacter galii]